MLTPFPSIFHKYFSVMIGRLFNDYAPQTFPLLVSQATWNTREFGNRIINYGHDFLAYDLVPQQNRDCQILIVTCRCFFP